MSNNLKEIKILNMFPLILCIYLIVHAIHVMINNKYNLAAIHGKNRIPKN